MQDGAINRTRAEALIAKLNQLDALGRYYALAVMHVVSGRAAEKL